MRKTIFFSILAVVVFLSACGREKKVPSPSENATPIVQEPTRVPTPVLTQEPSQEPTAIPTEAPTPILTPTPKETIRWVLGFFDKLTEEEKAEINRLLKEKGFECKIQFIDSKALVGEEYQQWYKLNNGVYQNFYDIVSSSGWSTRNGPRDFILENFLELTEFMKTEEGKALYDAFAPLDWERVKISGKIYSLPSVVPYMRNNSGVYISVNDRYSEYFRDYDGTYQSLRRIYEEIGDSSLVLRIELKPAVLFSFLKLRTMFNAYPYSTEEHCFVSPLELGEELDQLADWIYEDLQDGFVQIPDDSEPDSSKILAEIYYLDRPKKEGYSDYLLTESIVTPYLSLNYGISKNCTNKDQVFRVLAFCYTDPDISAILRNMNKISTFTEYRVTEEWSERLERLGDLDVSQYELTGFLPETDPKLARAENELINDLAKQFELYFLSGHEDKTLTEVLSKYRGTYYERLFEIINSQAEEYRKNH